MPIQSGNIYYEDQTIHFSKYGQGPALMLAFHDIGQRHDFIAALAAKIERQYTIISFDLPGCGQTQWEGTMSKTALVTIAERFKLEFKAEQLSLMACGMGGRYALTLAEQRSEWIDALWLHDPEGLSHNAWYSLESRAPLGRPVFRYFERQPDKALTLLRRLQGFRLVSKDRLQAMEQLLGHPDQLALRKQIWPKSKEIVPEPDKVRWQLKKHQIPVQLYCTRISEQQARRFARKLPDVAVHPGQDLSQMYADFCATISPAATT